MSEPPRRIELPPEAEPARKFIEALVERYEKRIRELGQQVQSLGPRLVSRGKPGVADVLDGNGAATC